MNLKIVKFANNLLLSDGVLESYDKEIDENDDSNSIDNKEILMNEQMNEWKTNIPQP